MPNKTTASVSPDFSMFSLQTPEDYLKVLQKESKKGNITALPETEQAPGIFLKTLYTAADTEALKANADFFASLAAVRKSNAYSYAETIAVAGPAQANSDALIALSGGANAVHFYLQNHGTADYAGLLGKISLKDTPVYFSANAELTREIQHEIKKYNPSRESIRGGILFDVFNSDKSGVSKEKGFELLESLLTDFTRSSKFQTVYINTQSVSDSVSDPVTELSEAITMFVECLDYLTDKGFAPAQVSQSAIFSMDIGTDYFTEIAKFRALRLLQAVVLDAYGVPPIYIPIYATGSAATHNPDDSSGNLLRNTTAAMAAVAGGADIIALRPHENGAQTKSSPARLAMNVSNILRYESMFERSADPAGGSFLIETMTNAFAKAAWERFLTQ
ncbi:MAG: methylmalonyl-CoA mutase family protein [Bacteroidota bacterium]